MCFLVSNEHPNELTAKKDIVCYKFLFNNRPIYQGRIIYVRGKRNVQVDLSVKEGIIRMGYHSYGTFKGAMQERYLHVNFWGDALFNRLVEFIIPKGAKYYKNDTEYVSSTIIRKKIIKRFK